MSRYGDDYVCTCEMHYVSCKNADHSSMCDLWMEPTFKSGDDEWDPERGILTVASSPWNNADEWIWDGDTPVCKRTTAQIRTDCEPVETIQDIVAEWSANSTFVNASPVEYVGKLEQEALDALTTGTAEVDEYGMIALLDGSYADFEQRVTYVLSVGEDGKATWTEKAWDSGETHDVELVETDAAGCTCTPEKSYYCHRCGVQRRNDSDPWTRWSGNSSDDKGSTTTWNWSKCHHVFETFILPGRQHRNIKISGSRTHTVSTTPDFGLYAYAGWNPSCIATFIPWQDYGLPTAGFVSAAKAIKAAWDLSCDDNVVEVGCMGGHGRTGTILACLAILSEPTFTAKQAINWVRKVHCNEAIETNQQEWYVEFFRCWVTGETAPEIPTTYVSKHSANWQAAGQAAQATKETYVPLAQRGTTPSPDGGYATNVDGSTPKWCSDCCRVVYTQHNVNCKFDAAMQAGKVMEFDPRLLESGETANRRRRNAKRANRRAAQRRRAAEKKASVLITQEVD